MKTMRCVDCYEEFSEEDVGDSEACPACGTCTLPMSIDEDILLPINWHELRVLTIWASNYAEKLPDSSRISLHKTLKRLDKYRPPGGAALTLVGEIKELQEHFPTASLYVDDELIVPPREDITRGDEALDS